MMEKSRHSQISKEVDNDERKMIARAQGGDEKSFNELVLHYRSYIRNVIRKMVAHPDDTEDIFQETLLSASQSIAKFRGESSFGTWVCRIAINKCTDFLRQQQSWRARAQVIYGNACYDDEQLGTEVFSAISAPDFEYDVQEHIAYCWSCVARSLPAEQNATLIYREFLGLTNRESAKAMKLSESVFRHHLSAARAQMNDKFDSLCALINKQGVCYQCAGLREGCPQEKRGEDVPQSLSMEERIKIVKNADLDEGRSQGMHDLFYRRTAELEACGQGNENETSRCYEPKKS